MKIQLQTNNNASENRITQVLNNITLILGSTRWLSQTTGKMKNIFLSFLFFTFFISTTRAQCVTYVQMALSAESCLVPVIVSSQQMLMPCSAPTGLYQLSPGDFAYIDYTPSNCATTCMQGLHVDITCFSPTVGIENQEAVNEIKIFPTLFQSEINIEGNNITKIELYNVCGTLLLELKNNNISIIDLSFLNKGVYFIKLVKDNQIKIKKIVKI